MPCPKFTKDVMGGIEALRSKMVSTNNVRRFKVIQNESNKKAISAITQHRFMLDGQGNVTLTPDDARGIADICDSLRYIGQNLFPVRGPQRVESTWAHSTTPADPNSPEERRRAEISSQHESQMKGELSKIIGEGGSQGGSGKKGGFFFNF